MSKPKGFRARELGARGTRHCRVHVKSAGKRRKMGVGGGGYSERNDIGINVRLVINQLQGKEVLKITGDPHNKHNKEGKEQSEINLRRKKKKKPFEPSGGWSGHHNNLRKRKGLSTWGRGLLKIHINNIVESNSLPARGGQSSVISSCIRRQYGDF